MLLRNFNIVLVMCFTSKWSIQLENYPVKWAVFKFSFINVKRTKDPVSEAGTRSAHAGFPSSWLSLISPFYELLAELFFLLVRRLFVERRLLPCNLLAIAFLCHYFTFTLLQIKCPRLLLLTAVKVSPPSRITRERFIQIPSPQFPVMLTWRVSV